MNQLCLKGRRREGDKPQTHSNSIKVSQTEKNRLPNRQFVHNATSCKETATEAAQGFYMGKQTLYFNNGSRQAYHTQQQGLGCVWWSVSSVSLTQSRITWEDALNEGLIDRGSVGVLVKDFS